MMNQVLNPDLVVAVTFLGMFVLAIAIVIVIQTLSSPSRRFDQRIEALKDRWGGAVTGSVAARRITRAGPHGGLDTLLKSVVPRPAELRKRLAKTGYNIQLVQYVISSGILIVGLSLLFYFGMDYSGPISLLLGLAVGMGLPHYVAGRLINRRLDKFTQLFPEAIDLIVRGLRSGLPISESMASVAKEIDGPVGIEFRRIVDGIKLGQDPDEALAETAERLDTADFRFFVISLSIQRETGGNLAETLENLADILRRRKQMKLKIKAMSSEARASALIIGSLPFIMLGILMLINYDYVSSLFNDPRGMMMGGFALFLMGTGAAIISKMVRFEI